MQNMDHPLFQVGLLIHSVPEIFRSGGGCALLFLPLGENSLCGKNEVHVAFACQKREIFWELGEGG